MNSLLKNYLLCLFAATALASDSDDDSGASGISIGSPDSPESPEEPTLSPGQQVLDQLIRACPCLEELDGDDGLLEFTEECLDDGFRCRFQSNGMMATRWYLDCAENRVVLDSTMNQCQVFESENGVPEPSPEDTITLTPAQTAICAAALAGINSELNCITPAPTLSPTPAPTAPTCQTFTLVSSFSFSDAGADDAARTAFATDLVTQAIGNAPGVSVQNVMAFDQNGQLGVTYTLCGSNQAQVDAAAANVNAAQEAGTVFTVNGIMGTITLNAPGMSVAPTAAPTPSPIPPVTVPPSVTPAPVPATTMFF